MNKGVILSTVFALGVCVAVAGCGLGLPRSVDASSSERADSSTANAIPAGGTFGTVMRDVGGAGLSGPLADALRYFVYAGLLICIVGGFAVAFGGKATGASLFIMGMVTTATGVYFSQYPWMTLVFGTVAFICLGAVLYDLRRERKKIQGTEAELAVKEEEAGAFGKTLGLFTTIVEKAPFGQDFKNYIRDNLANEMPSIKKVITPIKEELAKQETAKISA